MSGLTRRATLARRPEARAAASEMRSISRSDSALKARRPASTPARISSSVFPTPEKTIRSAGNPLSRHGAQLAARDDVRARAERGEARRGSRGSNWPWPRSRPGGGVRRTRSRSAGRTPRSSPSCRRRAACRTRARDPRATRRRSAARLHAARIPSGLPGSLAGTIHDSETGSPSASEVQPRG